MNREEHYEQGEALLDQMDSGEYDTPERLVLATKAQAHFTAALAAPLAWSSVGREILIEDGVIKP